MTNPSPSVTISASIQAGKKRSSEFAPLIIKFIIITCGCLGAAFTFLSCVDLEISLPAAAAVTAASCGIFSFIFSMKTRYCAAASGAVLTLLIGGVYALRYEICAGAAVTANRFLYLTRSEYREKPFIYIIEPDLADKHTLIFVCFALVMMCTLAAHSAFRSSSASGVTLATCVPVFSVLMFGLEPNNAAFFSTVVCWAAMFALEANAAESISDARCKRYSAYCGLYTALISAVCILAVMFFSKALGYQRPQKLNDAYDKAVEYIYGGGVQQVIDEIVTIATRNIGPTGAINHGKLGEFDEISFDGRTVLEVNIPKSEDTIYLRGFVGSVYTGKSWEQLPRTEQRRLDEITANFGTAGLSPQLLDGFNLKYTPSDMPKYSFEIKNTGANSGYLYMPYNLVPESVSRYKTESGDGFGGSERSYFGQFYDPRDYYGYRNLFRVRWSTPTALGSDEAAYRQFVYDNYLDLPESFSHEEIFNDNYLRYITAEAEITGKSSLDEMTVFNRKLYYIKRWLRDNCEYSLSTGKLRAGEDFVNKFLKERLGSCSQFASAAVLMCRYAGIPTRYVEGYVIKPADFPDDAPLGASVSVEVSDARGHAWAEVYIDGFGWYPVEFTSGYGNIRTAVPTETTVTETETESDTETETSEIVTTAVPDQDGNSPQSAQTAEPVLTADNAVTTTVPTAPAATDGYAQNTVSTAETTAGKPSIGFGVFGIKGTEKVDIYYDMTVPVVIAAIAAAVPLLIILRRRIILSGRRRAAYASARVSVLTDHRRFGRILRLMKMPEQGDMSYSEYIAALSESSLLADGTAETVINCALKASFGGDSLTRADANETRLAVNSLAKRYCETLSRFGRFKLKFLYCIL